MVLVDYRALFCIYLRRYPTYRTRVVPHTQMYMDDATHTHAGPKLPDIGTFL